MKQITRREFVAAGSAAALVVVSGGPVRAVAATRRVADVVVRRNVLDATAATDLATYKDAVIAMKARTDNLGWLGQANIHQNHCEHGTDLILPWHRAYIFYFEQIVRTLTSKPKFALPYWPYTPGTAAGPTRKLPAPFRDTNSALYDGGRIKAMNDGTGEIPSQHADPSAAMILADFDPFWASLENRPHNAVHNDTGGHMLTYQSPQDPIFWLHHAQIDRLWSQWKGRNPPSGSPWAAKDLVGFYDADGTPVQRKAGTVLNTQSQLGYRYDTEEAQLLMENLQPTVRLAAAPGVLIAKGPVMKLVGRRADFSARVPQPGAERFLDIPEGNGRLMLVIGGITAKGQVDVNYDVFLNLPNGAAPDPESPHYAGTLALFALGEAPREGHNHNESKAVEFDITESAAKLRTAERWKREEVSLQLFPSRPGVKLGDNVPTTTEISIGTVEVRLR